MIPRTLAAIVIFVSLFSTVSLASDLYRQEVTVSLDKDGNARIAEEYIVSLAESEFADFDNASQLGTTDLWRWERFTERTDVTVLGERTSFVIIGKRDNRYGYVTIAYDIAGLARQLKEEGRIVTRGLAPDQFAFYDATSGQFTIPPKTTLQVQLDDIRRDPRDDPEKYVTVSPPGININTGKPTVINNKIACSWRGPFTATSFGLSFQIERGLSESWGLEKMVGSVVGVFSQNPIYTVALLILVVLVAIYRRELFALIVESFAGEEPVVRPKKELK